MWRAVYLVLALLTACSQPVQAVKHQDAFSGPEITPDKIREGEPPGLTRQEVLLVEGLDLYSIYRRLEKAGFQPGPYNNTDFTHLSEAIKRFQQVAKLPADGRLDPPTWEKMQKLYDPVTPGQPVERPHPVSGSPAPATDREVPMPAQKQPDSGPRDIEEKIITKIQPEQVSLDYPLHHNDIAYALEKVECSDLSGAWVIFYRGIVVDTDEQTVALRLEERFGYRYYPKQEGIDQTNWWCIPRRRHCYSPISFHDWGGTLSKSQLQRFPLDAVYHAQIGIVNGIATLLQRHCGQ
jgi:hypothetical protein